MFADRRPVRLFDRRDVDDGSAGHYRDAVGELKNFVEGFGR
jgi:hypothetical protein